MLSRHASRSSRRRLCAVVLVVATVGAVASAGSAAALLDVWAHATGLSQAAALLAGIPAALRARGPAPVPVGTPPHAAPWTAPAVPPSSAQAPPGPAEQSSVGLGVVGLLVPAVFAVLGVRSAGRQALAQSPAPARQAESPQGDLEAATAPTEASSRSGLAGVRMAEPMLTRDDTLTFGAGDDSIEKPTFSGTGKGMGGANLKDEY